MKTFPLSSPAERICGIVFSLIMIPCLLVLLYALRFNIAVLIITALCVLLVVPILGVYVVSVVKAGCTPDLQNKKLHVRGIRSWTLDVSEAAQLETIAVKNGQVISRALIFTNAEGGIVGTVPTFFTSKQGLLAEPMAKELAKEMGLAFKANVPLWEYNEEARKEHEKEVALQEKEEAKQRRKARAARYQAKIAARREKLK